MTESSTILVIDDEVQIRRLLRITLEGAGYRVHEAETAADGIHEAATRRPDLIILDLGLPDADGRDVIAPVEGSSTSPSRLPLCRLQV